MENLDKQINIRVSKKDQQIIKKNAQKSGRTVSEHLRLMGINGKILIIHNKTKEIDNPGVSRRELVGLMNNLNQLIKLSHYEGKVIPGVNEVVNKIVKIMHQW